MKLRPLLFIVSVFALGACKPKTATVETPAAPAPTSSPMATRRSPESSAAPASVAAPTAQPKAPTVNGHVYLVKRHTKATDTGIVAFKEGTLAQVTRKNGKTVTLYMKGQTIEVPIEDVTTESPVASAE